MATYVYDDYRVTFTPRADGAYDVRAVPTEGLERTGVFTVPFDPDELARAVLGVARSVTAFPRAGDEMTRGTRDVGSEGPPVLDAERVGGALADALLGGDVGAGYVEALRTAASRGHGVRLTLSLGAAPRLLGLPWELLYRRPRFLANQRHTPLVRHLDVPGLPQPPAIQGTVHVLGVVAAPDDCAPLDVDAERARVEQAVATVRAMGRVELDWLDPATPRRLREALRDGAYHVLHYVGHGDVTAAGESVLLLERPGGGHVEVDGTELANLLADQTSLRLVVLNSCEGARTTVDDPFAGVATTLVHLGVPAVVAMQFEISDRAAILFAEELYTNLIGRQAPIDASVSEARKALYIEEGTVEWATPVLFMADPDVELFRFEVDPAPLPPPPPPEAPFATEPKEASPPERAPRRRRTRLLVGAVGLVAVVVAAVVWRAQPDAEDDAVAAGATTPGTPVTAPPVTATTAPAVDATAPAAAPVASPTTAAGVVAEVPPFEPVTFEGNVAEADGTDEVPVELIDGQIVYVAGLTDCGPQLDYRLVAPSGAQYGGAPGVCSDLGRVEVPESGTWTVVVEGYGGGSGPYRLSLAPVPPDTVSTVVPGDSLVDELTAAGEQHRYTFEGAARDLLYLDGRGDCTDVMYRLIGPSGSALGGEPGVCSDLGRVELVQSGTHTVVVRGFVRGFGVYDIALLPVPPDATAPIDVGGTARGELLQPGERHLYTFRADAGDVVGVVGSGGDTCGPVEYRLLDPSGTQVGGAPGVCNDLGPLELPASGEYTLEVRGFLAGTGAYALELVAG